MLLAGAALGFAPPWVERADATTGVALELRPLRQVIRVGEKPKLEVTLINRGSRPVTLVDAGDDSLAGWRTPVIQWSTYPSLLSPVCANTNPLKAKDVFNLAPGERRRLSAWVLSPVIPRPEGGVWLGQAPGHYRVSVRYRNEPNLRWLGVPLGSHDPDAMRRVRQSTRVCATSNFIEVIVQE
jgi:hypothetical protein